MDSHGLAHAVRVSRLNQRRISMPFSGKTEVTVTNEAPRRTANSIDGSRPPVNATETRLTLSDSHGATRKPPSDLKPRPATRCSSKPWIKCDPSTHPADTLRKLIRLRRTKPTTFHETSAPPLSEPKAITTSDVRVRTVKSIDERQHTVKTAGYSLPPIASPRTSSNDDHSEFGTTLQSRPFRPRTILDDYKPIREIGKGSFGVVYAVEERHATSRKPKVFACKVLKADNTNCESGKQVLQDALKEVDLMMSSSGHPNLQDLVDFAVTDDRMYIISSMCYGGDLRTALDKHGVLCEVQARSAMAGIFRGLSHLHSQGIVHRDIKLDNILVAEKGNLGSVKIIDMGFAKKLYPQNAGAEALHTVCGSPIYIAPEMVAPSKETGTIEDKTEYGMKVDMWSCGVVMYMLLSGYPPFSFNGSNSMQELFADIRKGRFSFDEQVWHGVSESAKNLIMGLLNVDPNMRLSAQRALRHPWFLDSSDNFLDSFAVAPPRIRSKIAGTARKNLRVSNECGFRS